MDRFPIAATGHPFGTGLLRPEYQIDAQRLAAAYRAKAAHRNPRPAKALIEAVSAEPCPRCGIPGRKGCAHQLPYVAPHAQRGLRFGPEIGSLAFYSRKRGE